MRGNKDSCLVSKDLHAIIFPILGACVTAVGDLIHAAADPVKAIDELVAFGVLVVGGDADGELAGLAVYGDGFDAGGYGRGFVAAGAEGCGGQGGKAGQA